MADEEQRLELIREVLEAVEPDFQDVNRARQAAVIQRQKADQRFTSLRDGRKSVLIRGSSEEIETHDRNLEAAERERDRWNAIIDELDPISRKARERHERKKAGEVLEGLPELVQEVEDAREAYELNLQKLRTQAGRVTSADIEVDQGLADRIQRLTGQDIAPARHGLRMA